MQERSDSIVGEQETGKQTVAFLELVPDIWERLPHFQDNIEKILFSPEDLLDPKTMKYKFQLTDEDRLSSDQDESDQIWVDQDSSEMDKHLFPPSQPQLTRSISESLEDLGEIQGDATAFSVDIYIRTYICKYVLSNFQLTINMIYFWLASLNWR